MVQYFTDWSLEEPFSTSTILQLRRADFREVLNFPATIPYPARVSGR